jgi:SNF2 family DNA or RNA helicase
LRSEPKVLIVRVSLTICRHLVPGTVSVHRYHGTEKRIDVADLLRKDIVLTTYATVAADFCRGRSTLNHIAWYRLVLDEGDIFSSSTKASS